MMGACDPAMTIRVPIGSDADLSWVRQQVRQRAAELAFGLVQQTKLVTAASELARNTLVYGGGGTWRSLRWDPAGPTVCASPSSTRARGFAMSGSP